MKQWRYVIVAVALATGVAVYIWPPGPIHFAKFTAADFTQQLAPLMLASIFIERSLEVFITAWRGGKAADLQRDIDKATQLAGGDPARLGLVQAAQDKLSQYKSVTQQIALPAALILGILISALGIRGLGNFVDKSSFHGQQQNWFTVADVLLTGSLVGGGSDVVHQVINAFTNFLNPPQKP
jgi:hypothetical protein